MFIRSQEADRCTDAQAAFPLFFFLFILSGIPAHETVQIGSSSLGFFLETPSEAHAKICLT